MKRPKILVARGGALGDFILTLPVLAALRRRFPEHELHILGYPAIASLAVAGGLADGVTSLESPALAGFFARDAVLPAQMTKYFAGFELIVSYICDPEQIFQGHVSRCGAARFIAGPHRPDESLKLHAAEALLRPLEALGVRGADPRPRLVLPGAVQPPKRARLAIHPGSGGEQKNWPESKWAAFLPLLAEESQWDFLLIAGEAEGARAGRLASVLPSSRLDLAQNLPLVELAQRMRACRAYIGHDSGVTHLAAALDLPGLVLWGPSSEAVWRPLSGTLRLLRGPRGLKALPVETVRREAKAMARPPVAPNM
jgi:ADP-heptose:LPS heptosyltransferase